MPFVTLEDYKKQIREDVLNEVLEDDDDIRVQSEVAALEEMDSFLNSRYDMVNIFNKTGAARSALLLMYAIDMTLYHIHSRINPRMIPELREHRYTRAITALKEITKGLMNPPGLPRLVIQCDEVEVGSRFGTNHKLNGQT